MTALVKYDDSKIRAKHRSWDMRVSNAPMFEQQVTLDPCDTEDAWEQLSVNTSFIEFQELPVRLHRSLVKALNRSLQRVRKP